MSRCCKQLPAFFRCLAVQLAHEWRHTAVAMWLSTLATHNATSQIAGMHCEPGLALGRVKLLLV